MTPRCWPITSGDRALYGSGVTYPQIVAAHLEFNGRLDIDRLECAARRTVERFPVLGCTGDPVRHRCWMPTASDERPLRIEVMEAVGLSEAEAERMLEDRLNLNLDVREEPPLRLWLQRRDRGDRLLVTQHHSVGDGQAHFLVLEALHEAYHRLGSDPGWRPEPDATPRSVRWLLSHHRGGWLWVLLSRLPLGVWREIARRKSGGWVAGSLQSGVRRRYLRIGFSAKEMERVHRAAKARGRTINDVMLAAKGLAWRAMRRESGLNDTNLLIGMLVNLRRAAGLDGRGVANFSSAEILLIPRREVAGERLADRIMDAAARAKRGLPGVASLSALLLVQALIPARWLVPRFERLWNFTAARTGLGCWFTNLGALPDSLFDWDGVLLEDAAVHVAVTQPPTIIGSIATWRGKCNVLFGWVEGYLNPAQAARLEALFRQGIASVVQSLENETARSVGGVRAV